MNEENDYLTDPRFPHLYLYIRQTKVNHYYTQRKYKTKN